MAKENDITSIRVPKTVKDELKKVALEKEPYHATIQRLIRENTDLRISNNMLQNNIKFMEREKKMKMIVDDINRLDKDYKTAYMVMWKIASDLVPSADERVQSLINNDFLTGLINDGKSEGIHKASELVKEQIRLGDERYYDQLDIVDEYLEYVDTM